MIESLCDYAEGVAVWRLNEVEDATCCPEERTAGTVTCRLTVVEDWKGSWGGGLNGVRGKQA